MTTATPAKQLWPGTKIEVIGGSGEFAQGKTLFGLTIDPANTIVYDHEGSTACYEGLGFTRVDMSGELLRAFPNGAKSAQRFVWWRNHVRANCPPGKYSVIMLDPVSEIESALADYVWDNPAEFGFSKAQFEKSTGLYWGSVKEFWKQVLEDLRVRCQTLYFTAHMRNQYAGNAPTGKREEKGKETLLELASLYLRFERKPNAAGVVPAVPAARVLKSRLANTKLIDGEPVVEPILPPRLPEATPKAIRAYIAAPPDYAKLKAGEKAPEETLSDDDKLRLTAQLEASRAEAARMELALRDQQAGAIAAQAAGAAAAAPITTPPTATKPFETPPASQPAAACEAKPHGPPAQQELLAKIKKALPGKFSDPADYVAYLKKTYGIDTAQKLTEPQAAEFYAFLIQSPPAAPHDVTRTMDDRFAELVQALEIPVDIQLKSIQRRDPAAKKLADLTHDQQLDVIHALEKRLQEKQSAAGK